MGFFSSLYCCYGAHFGLGMERQLIIFFSFAVCCDSYNHIYKIAVRKTKKTRSTWFGSVSTFMER